MTRVRALDRKVLRDLVHMAPQMLAIALVMACGVAMFVMSLGTIGSLEATRSAYYERARFADVFARLERAPNALEERIAEVPGVAVVQTRVVAEVTLDVPGLREPAAGRLISLPGARPPKLNALHLRRGRRPEPGRRGEVLVGEAFADAHDLEPGDRVSAVINGRLERLRLVGIVLSPEYVFQIRPGELLPDDRGYGIFWMNEDQLAPAWDMDGAFNDVALRLEPGASEREVIERLDRLLEPWGGLGAHGRKDQPSHELLSNEIQQLRGMAVILPTIFLAVAAFLLNIVLSRLIRTEREEIATLKAFGYSRQEIGAHYLKLVGLVVLLGLVLGTGGGAWLGQGLAGIYARFFRFPLLEYPLDTGVIALAILAAGGAAVAGTLGAVRSAMRLPPAEAMRPEAPAAFRPTLAEGLGIQHFFSNAFRMILRGLERQPGRSILSGVGLALAAAVYMLGSFGHDVFEEVVELQFFRGQRYDASITFVEPISSSGLHAVSNLPGVIQAEPFRAVPARLRFGHRERRTAIVGIPARGSLQRVIDERRGEISLPPEGLVVSEMLADLLGAGIGDVVAIEVLEGAKPVHEAPVTDLVRDFAGLSAWMSLDALHRTMREEGSLSGAYVSLDERRLDEFYTAVKETPRIAGINLKAKMLESFRETVQENILIMRTFNVLFAGIIAFGVVYNLARISLAERSRELGTLRVMGFTRGEISAILLGELAVLVLVAVPVGLLLGYVLLGIVTVSLATETQRFPLVVSPSTFGAAATVVLLAALLSGISVHRRIARFDLVSVLKARD